MHKRIKTGSSLHTRQGNRAPEAYFSGHGYEPHRHDTYDRQDIVWCTTFPFAIVNNMVNNIVYWWMMVLHPDEIMMERQERSRDFSIGCFISSRLLFRKILGGINRLPLFTVDPI